MAVTVSLARGKRVHDSGTAMRVDDNGHLHVVKSSGTSTRTVAIYAPGNWTSATTEGGEQQHE